MSKNKTITITLPMDVYENLQKETIKNKRSRSNQVAVILSKHYEKEGKKDGRL